MIAGKHVKEDGLENDLCDMILADPMFMITKEELDAILQPENFTGRSEQQTEEFVDTCIRPVLAANASLIGERYEMKNWFYTVLHCKAITGYSLPVVQIYDLQQSLV